MSLSDKKVYLSDKILEERFEGFYLPDVKEFIKQLKEELCGFDKVGELAYKEIFENIDKLAGKDLI